MAESATKSWIARRGAVMPRGLGMFAGETTVASAKGARLVDAEGRELIDLAGGIGVMNVGHCDETVVAAICEQARRLVHTCIHVATYEPYLALCEKLVELLPHGERTKAMLVNTGVEAVENAVKIARQATRRPALVCFDDAFHGRTLLGMSLTAKSAYKKNCGPFAPEVYRIPFPNRFRHGNRLDEERFVARELSRLRERFVSGLVPAENVAAIILEVVQGEGGFVVAPPAYLRGLRQICDEHGIMLVFDEVQSGFCRTGKWAAWSHSGVVPDLSTYAKSMGGGLPIGAVIGKAEVMDAAEPGTLGGTYGGNPVACASALATIRVMQEKRLNERATEIGETARRRLEALQDTCDVVADVRGLGAMLAVELCHGRDPEKPAAEVVARVTARCREDGVLVLPAGARANIIRLLSPLVIEPADLDRALDVIESAIRESAH